jgi:hypothetical protein
MEAKCFSETSVDFQRITRRYISEKSTLHNHRSDNYKPYIGNPDHSFLSYSSNNWVEIEVWDPEAHVWIIWLRRRSINLKNMYSDRMILKLV